MNKIIRRSFLRTGAAAGAAEILHVLPTVWYELARADQPGYFEAEFGVSFVRCI